jgi:DNA-binding CsgD family transcriptional regulator
LREKVVSAECIGVRLRLSAILSLSPREHEVLRCYLAGMSVSDIAAKFARSSKTISTQKQSALRKLGIRSDAELFASRKLLEEPERQPL